MKQKESFRLQVLKAMTNYSLTQLQDSDIDIMSFADENVKMEKQDKIFNSLHAKLNETPKTTVNEDIYKVLGEDVDSLADSFLRGVKEVLVDPVRLCRLIDAIDEELNKTNIL